MQFNMADVKKSLGDFKTAVLDKMKATDDATSEKINKMGEDLTKHVDDQLAQMKKRKLSLPGLEEELKKKTFHLSKCVLAQVQPDGWDSKYIGECGFEKEVLAQADKMADESRRKSNNAQTGEAGGFLIPDEVTSEIIELAMAKTPVMEMGPSVIRGLRGELPIPKTTGRPQMFWVGEEEAPTETTTKFGEIILRPKTAAAFTKVSRRLLFQTANTAERIVRDEIMKAFRLGLDLAFLDGLGSEKEPKGILNFDNLTSTVPVDAANDGNRFRIDKASEMAMNIDVQNMLRGNLGYIMRPEVLSFMLRERVRQFTGQDDAKAQPIDASNVLMSQAQLESIIGYKIRTTTLLPLSTIGSNTSASSVIFGDWSQLVIGMWEGFEIKASDVAGNNTGSAFTQRQVWITAFQGVDSNIKDESGLTKVDDALVDPTEFTA